MSTIKIDDGDKLYILDTLHDFWKERTLTKKITNNDEENEDESLIDPEKQTKIRKTNQNQKNII